MASGGAIPSTHGTQHTNRPERDALEPPCQPHLSMLLVSSRIQLFCFCFRKFPDLSIESYLSIEPLPFRSLPAKLERVLHRSILLAAFKKPRIFAKRETLAFKERSRKKTAFHAVGKELVENNTFNLPKLLLTIIY